MRFDTLFFLLMLSCLYFALAQSTYEDCCFKYVKSMSHRTQRHAVAYREQVTDGGCNIPAIIFTMRRGREFCTDPRENWVAELRKKVDDKNRAKNGRKTPRKQHQLHRG